MLGKLRLARPVFGSIMTNQQCVFCKIIAGTIPATIIAQNDAVIVINDIAPKAPIHYLIIPKKHHKDLVELTSQDFATAGKLVAMAAQIAQKLEGNKSFKLISNNGAGVGQSVFHAHIHFLAGKQMTDF